MDYLLFKNSSLDTLQTKLFKTFILSETFEHVFGKCEPVK